MMTLFITFEGVEGSGKSTQAAMLSGRLVSEGKPTILTREPGGTSLGERISQLLKWSDETDHIAPLAEVMLFNASRTELVTSVIRPALASGKTVVCDRYIDSTLVYQGNGRGLPGSTIKAVNSIAIQGLMPNLTFLLDLPVDDGMERKKGLKADRFEKENLYFHRRVRDGYLALSATEPSRWVVIDATLSKDRIAGLIWQKVIETLNQQTKTQ
jgi:dTMP kinase